MRGFWNPTPEQLIGKKERVMREQMQSKEELWIIINDTPGLRTLMRKAYGYDMEGLYQQLIEERIKSKTETDNGV